MSTNVPQITIIKIDLFQISKKKLEIFSGIECILYLDAFYFLLKNGIIILILLIVGFGLGYYLDKIKEYNHQVIVAPNFKSTDYSVF
jgi:hypothetical protein